MILQNWNSEIFRLPCYHEPFLRPVTTSVQGQININPPIAEIQVSSCNLDSKPITTHLIQHIAANSWTFSHILELLIFTALIPTSIWTRWALFRYPGMHSFQTIAYSLLDWTYFASWCFDFNLKVVWYKGVR